MLCLYKRASVVHLHMLTIRALALMVCEVCTRPSLLRNQIRLRCYRQRTSSGDCRVSDATGLSAPATLLRVVPGIQMDTFDFGTPPNAICRCRSNIKPEFETKTVGVYSRKVLWLRAHTLQLLLDEYCKKRGDLPSAHGLLLDRKRPLCRYRLANNATFVRHAHAAGRMLTARLNLLRVTPLKAMVRGLATPARRCWAEASGHQ